MIDISDLQSCTCKVINPYGICVGTAFFVGANLLVTSLHVVSDFIGADFIVEKAANNRIEVRVKDHCPENDLALLITKIYSSETFAVLCNEMPVVGTSWASYGHPGTFEGLKVGTKLVGDIFDIITLKHEHDVVLKPNEIVSVKEYRGFSGSGVINVERKVTSILRYKDNNTLCSVSVKKSENFFKSHGIIIEEDQLNDFSAYIPDVFQAVANPFKGFGIANAKVVAQKLSPQIIAAGLKGKLLIPERAGSLKEIIAYLKSQSILNKQLWLAWLEFLSYVQLLKGEYSNINALYISLPQVEVSKFVANVETKIKQDITLTLQFFFTEDKEYFTIARQYLLDKSTANVLQHNHCHVFHSLTPMFGLQPFTKEDKKKIIPDISSPTDAGLNIAGEIDYGVLSFLQLSMKVAGSQTIAEATINLTKIFVDAIS